MTKVEAGIQDSDFVIIVLSRNSVQSSWVDKEWKAKYWQEINQRTVLVLPILVDDCEIPLLLATKKYANFKKAYAVGFAELAMAITPASTIGTSSDPSVTTKSINKAISELIAKIQSRQVPLSQCVAEALSLARDVANQDLESFCRRELRGIKTEDLASVPESELSHRVVPAFVSVAARINPSYLGFRGNPSEVFEYMRSNPDDFIPVQYRIGHSISELEAEAASTQAAPNDIGQITSRAGNFFRDVEHPSVPVYGYLRMDSYKSVLESCRAKLTAKLLALLPAI